MRSGAIILFADAELVGFSALYLDNQSDEDMGIKLSKSQRRLIKRMLAPYQKRAKVSLYRVFVALAYLVKTGCQWKMLPDCFPKPTTVYHHFRKWSEAGKPIRILKMLTGRRRKCIGRKPPPTVAVIDSRSVRSAHARSQKSVDGFKKVKGIKRHILVDSNGYPLLADVSTANTSEAKGAANILKELRLNFRTIALLKADMGYRGMEPVDGPLTVECVKSNFGTCEFKPCSGR